MSRYGDMWRVAPESYKSTLSDEVPCMVAIAVSTDSRPSPSPVAPQSHASSSLSGSQLLSMSPSSSGNRVLPTSSLITKTPGESSTRSLPAGTADHASPTSLFAAALADSFDFPALALSKVSLPLPFSRLGLG